MDGVMVAAPEPGDQSVRMKIGVLGATGPAGRGLATRLASAGFDVVVGSRSKYRALEVVDRILETWPDRQLCPSAGTNHDVRPSAIASIWPNAVRSAFFHGSRPNTPGST